METISVAKATGAPVWCPSLEVPVLAVKHHVDARIDIAGQEAAKLWDTAPPSRGGPQKVTGSAGKPLRGFKACG